MNTMRKAYLSLAFILLAVCCYSQSDNTENSVSLLFIGDIMGHDSQIASALDPATGKYSYDGVFDQVGGIIKEADFAIANLEVTLAGPPFKGYPQFSSPDALAVSCQENGIDVLVTANNHSCDRGKGGILRTLNTLDSLKIKHTGTFRNQNERSSENLLVLEKNNIKIGILNYTYGTNGLPAPSPTVVNLINRTQILKDIESSKSENLDKLIVVLHWGKEYQPLPSKKQIDLGDFLFESGVDIVIGSHPHVLQPMEYHEKNDQQKERFIAYSLGNFVSNQRTSPRDGGAMVQLTISKENNETSITNQGYYLTWVNKPKTGSNRFQIISCDSYEKKEFEGLDAGAVNKMKIFTDNSRNLLQKNNVAVEEIK